MPLHSIWVFAVLVGRSAAAGLPSLREQAEIRSDWRDARVREFLPSLMEENNVSHWVIASREYNEDTVWRSLASPLSIQARRRTVQLFSLNATRDGIDEHELVSFEPSLWNELRDLLESEGNIALNIDSTFAFSDGLSVGELEVLATIVATRC